jgi:hypothetical protein
MLTLDGNCGKEAVLRPTSTCTTWMKQYMCSPSTISMQLNGEFQGDATSGHDRHSADADVFPGGLIVHAVKFNLALCT